MMTRKTYVAFVSLALISASLAACAGHKTESKTNATANAGGGAPVSATIVTKPGSSVATPAPGSPAASNGQPPGGATAPPTTASQTTAPKTAGAAPTVQPPASVNTSNSSDSQPDQSTGTTSCADDSNLIPTDAKEIQLTSLVSGQDKLWSLATVNISADVQGTKLATKDSVQAVFTGMAAPHEPFSGPQIAGNVLADICNSVDPKITGVIASKVSFPNSISGKDGSIAAYRTDFLSVKDGQPVSKSMLNPSVIKLNTNSASEAFAADQNVKVYQQGTSIFIRFEVTESDDSQKRTIIATATYLETNSPLLGPPPAVTSDSAEPKPSVPAADTSSSSAPTTDSSKKPFDPADVFGG